MAVVNTPQSTTLRLQVQTGTDDGGKPIYRLRSYSRVKPDAVDQDLYDVATTLSNLQVHSLNAISQR